jgi:hypothetical protein
MKIILKTLKQETFPFEIEGDHISVSCLKALIETEFNFDGEKIKLLFNGVVLENNKNLVDYSIKEDFSIIMTNVRPKQGNLAKASEKSDDYQIESEENASSTGIFNKISSFEDDEDTLYEAKLTPDNVVRYVASIMKVLCLKSPQKAKDFFKNLEVDNPAIMSIIKKNEAEFKSLLYSQKTDQDVKIYKQFFKGELTEDPPIKSVNPQTSSGASEEDVENIKKLQEYGYGFNEAREAYYACEKQIDLALNFLLENK